MEKYYQKIKGLLSDPNMFHVLYTFVLTVFAGCFFNLIDTADKMVTVFVSGFFAFFLGFIIESMDGRQGTKQYEETGVEGNSFSVKDLTCDAVGAVLGMIAITGLIM